MAFSTEDLTKITSILSSNVNTYLERLNADKIPVPTLNPGPPIFLKDESALKAKDDIIQACERIIALVQAPFESMLVMATSYHETSALHIALDMKLHEHIPISGGISLAELTEKVGGSQDLILRVLRVLANRNCFVETSPLHYAHTSLSATLTVPVLNAVMGHCVEEVYFSAAHVPNIVRENGFAVPDDPTKTAFNRAFETDKKFFDFLYSNPDRSRAERFGLAMKGFSLGGQDQQIIYPPLLALPAGSVFCDVGGSLGHDSIRIAKACPGLKLFVQDSKEVVEQGRADCPEELKDRVEYQAIDFFSEQPVKGADVYYLKAILHDYPDSSCVKILSHIIAAMDPQKSRILLHELVLPERIGPVGKRFSHLIDFQMLTLCNSSERTEDVWRKLLKKADKRLTLEKVWGGERPILECRLVV